MEDALVGLVEAFGKTLNEKEEEVSYGHHVKHGLYKAMEALESIAAQDSRVDGDTGQFMLLVLMRGAVTVAKDALKDLERMGLYKPE